MKPLKPDDLLLRNSPVDQDRWTEGEQSSNGHVIRKQVRLERFQELEQIVRNNPVQSEPYVELARIYLHQEKWIDAKRILDRAAEQFSSDEDVLYLREESQLARSLHLLSYAEAEHRRVPNDVSEKEVQRAKVDLNAMRERVCRARLVRHPEHLELTIPLADALEQLDRAEEAVDYLRQASQDPELRAAANLKLGEIFERNGRVTDALAAYRRAALFRIPQPTPAIRMAALSKAAELALAHRLLDSAARYVAMLRELEPQNLKWIEMDQEIVALESSLLP